MWDDKLNKKIKDAANQYHPAYEENAWDKMELLLDKHLPVEKKRKKRYFLLPVIALLMGSLFIVYYKQTNFGPKNSQKAETKNNQKTTNVTSVQESQQKPLTTIDPSLTATTKPAATPHQASPLVNGNFNSQLKRANNKAVESTTNKTLVNTTGKTNSTIIQSSVETETGIENNRIENPAKDVQQNSTKENMASEATAANVNKPVINNEIAEAKKDAANTKGVTKTKNTTEADGKKKPTNSNKSFSNNFAIGFSAGPDVSSVGFNNWGKIAINYGIGLSYAVSSRFTLHTGFYISEKIYSADKDQYHAPPGSANYNYLYNINADCKVYDIPVTVSYSFGKSKNHQWFVSGGLSSYLMKKESYDYYYKYPSGYTDWKSWSISNQNQHYFSVLDLSGGYQYLFNKRISLLTEPYLKIPLTGVGEGKVKLNSAGILFTLGIKPFYKK